MYIGPVLCSFCLTLPFLSILMSVMSWWREAGKRDEMFVLFLFLPSSLSVVLTEQCVCHVTETYCSSKVTNGTTII